VGQFKNIHGNPPIRDKWNAVAQETFHWFEVNIDDLGEPGNRADAPLCTTTSGAFCCPVNGFTCGDDSGDETKCACADFYRIKIHRTASPASEVIYGAQGYIDGGNFQIHPPIDH
jgi:hypothetical protein